MFCSQSESDTARNKVTYVYCITVTVLCIVGGFFRYRLVIREVRPAVCSTVFYLKLKFKISIVAQKFGTFLLEEFIHNIFYSISQYLTHFCTAVSAVRSLASFAYWLFTERDSNPQNSDIMSIHPYRPGSFWGSGTELFVINKKSSRIRI